MFAMLVVNNLVPNRYRWPQPIRNAAMIIVGYTIGLSMTAAA